MAAKHYCMKHPVTVSLLVVLLLSCFGFLNKSLAKPKPLSRGESIYSANCQGCHRQGTNPLRPEKQLGESTKLASQSIFRDYLSSKHGMMPRFQAIAANNIDLKELYLYAKSLKNQFWEYPQLEPQPQDQPMKDNPPANNPQ